ncbi:hypothetical protein niasHS_007811 [Heterodera schachtii]|uniref:CHK kinase-like domain-containing protein n=1 Tax=Heterodera schachtii TaxID=97005 RepID=A0ABD2JPW8_HETSC
MIKTCFLINIKSIDIGSHFQPQYEEISARLKQCHQYFLSFKTRIMSRILCNSTMCADEQRLSIRRDIGWFNNCVVSLKKHKSWEVWYMEEQRRQFVAIEEEQMRQEMPLRAEIMGQAAQVGAALLYTLIHMKMRRMFTPSGGSSQGSDDNNNEKNIQQGLQLADFAYFAFWLKRVEEAFRSRFEKEKEQFCWRILTKFPTANLATSKNVLPNGKTRSKLQQQQQQKEIEPNAIGPLLCRILPKVRVENLAESFYDVDKYGFPACIVHADLWAPNIMWTKNAEGQASDQLGAIIDWQTFHSGNPCEDIGRLLALNTTSAYRRANINQLLAFYAKKVAEFMGGNAPFTLAQLKKAFVGAMPYVMMFFCFGTTNYCTMESVVGKEGTAKREENRVGDDSRLFTPPEINGQSCYTLGLNRNKKSIAMNLAHPEAQNLAQKLATKADIVIENFKTGYMKNFCLDYPQLAQLNPGLIYCSITGYGPEGPCANDPGYDVIAAAVGGFLGITGLKGGDQEPVKAGVAVTDLATGLYAHGAILAALSQNQNGKVNTIREAFCHEQTQHIGIVKPITHQQYGTVKVVDGGVIAPKSVDGGSIILLPVVAIKTVEG